MGAKGKLRTLEGGMVSFYCPGCKCYHGVNVDPVQGTPCWGFNRDYQKPTFTPSILVQGTRLTEKGEADYKKWCDEGCPKGAGVLDSVRIVCHSFVTDGRIQYLSDCTHALAGQTIEMDNEEEEGAVENE